MRVVGDGISALSLARTAKPGSVVLDLGLPGLDGLDVTRELRKSMTVPIIMLTARGDEPIGSSASRLGADDYLVEAVQPERTRRARPRPPAP